MRSWRSSGSRGRWRSRELLLVRIVQPVEWFLPGEDPRMRLRLLIGLCLSLLVAGPLLADSAPVIWTGVKLRPAAEPKVQMAWGGVEIGVKLGPEEPNAFVPGR